MMRRCFRVEIGAVCQQVELPLCSERLVVEPNLSSRDGLRNNLISQAVVVRAPSQVAAHRNTDVFTCEMDLSGRALTSVLASPDR